MEPHPVPPHMSPHSRGQQTSVSGSWTPVCPLSQMESSGAEAAHKRIARIGRLSVNIRCVVELYFIQEQPRACTIIGRHGPHHDSAQLSSYTTLLYKRPSRRVSLVFFFNCSTSVRLLLRNIDSDRTFKRRIAIILLGSERSRLILQLSHAVQLR